MPDYALHSYASRQNTRINSAKQSSLSNPNLSLMNYLVPDRNPSQALIVQGQNHTKGRPHVPKPPLLSQFKISQGVTASVKHQQHPIKTRQSSVLAKNKGRQQHKRLFV